MKNFDKFQRFKYQNPPWIKLHTILIDDPDFESLPELTQLHLIKIWILAAKIGNKLPLDSAWISKKIGSSSQVDLKLLVSCSWILVLSGCNKKIILSSSDNQPGTPEYRVEKSRVETEKEWLSALCQNSAYFGIDIENELNKMKTWCEVNKKMPSKRRFINWLNRADKPLLSKINEPKPHWPKAPAYLDEWKKDE